MEGFALHQSVQGEPRWSLSAASATLHDDSKEADLAQPAMEFQKAGRTVSRVHALQGRVHTVTKDVVLSSAVVLEGLEERSVLKTERLEYSSKEDLFHTDADVLVTRPEGVLRGRGLKAKPDLSEIRIFNQESVVKEKKKA